MAQANGDFLAERRGVVTDGEVLSFAEALGVEPWQVNIKRLAQISHEDGVPLAARILYGRRLMEQAATAYRDAMVAAATGGDAEVAAYGEARQRLVMIARTVSAITAEWGRAGRAFRDLAGWQATKDLAAFAEQQTGRTLFQLQQEAKLGAKLETPAQVAKFAKEMSQTPWQKVRAGILSYFINNLISGPLTHAAYTVGNTTYALFKAGVTTPAAATVGAIREAMAGKPVDRVYFGEAGAQLYGMVRGLRDGFGPGVEAMKTGVPFMKGDVDAQGALQFGESVVRKQSIAMQGDGALANAVNRAGYVLETPSRAVSAIHTVFYSMNYEAEIASRAFRQAMSEGLDGQAFDARVAELTQNPPREMIDAAHDEALRMVLMKRPAFGSAQYHLQRAVNGNFLAKLVMPFMQIGGNILREGFVEHSPIGFASKEVRANLAGENGAVARDSQAARIGVGVGLSVAVLGLAAEGILTGGGPSDPNERRTKELTGWKQYSIRVGEYYVPYKKYLGPLGPLIAGVADLYETGHAISQQGLGKAAAGAAFGFAEVVADESWMKGLANFVNAARNWDKDGGKYLRDLAMDFLPFSVGMSQVAQLLDPYRRQVTDVTEAARNHIPVAREGLYPQRDIWGQPIPGGTIMSPSAVRNDPAAEALLRLQIFPAPVERKVRGVDLTERQYDDLTRIAGINAKMQVTALVSQPGFAALPVFAQKQLIETAIERSREMARGLIMMQNQSIPTSALEHKQALVNQQPGQTVPKRITQPAGTP